MVKVSAIAWRLGFQAQYFYGFTNGGYDKPNLCTDLTLHSTYHNMEMSKQDSIILLGRVIEYYKSHNYPITDRAIDSTLYYILNCDIIDK